MKITLMLSWAIMSVIAFIAYGYDKFQAKSGGWRVSEKTLLLLALFMGAPGAVVGMKVFHHKTQKQKFLLIVPVLCFLQAGVLYYFYNR